MNPLFFICTLYLVCSSVSFALEVPQIKLNHFLSKSNGGPFRKQFPSHGDLHLGPADPDPGEALFLTPLLEAGKIKEAQALSKVSLGHRYGHSFTGFFTVNKKFNSNLFFWFCPARSGVQTSPVLVWLQGGPGGSSLFGLFSEHGPFKVENNLLVPRNYSWNANHNVLYIDNPVGTGFSFTNDSAGYAKNEVDVGRDLYGAMLQFYMLFPDLKDNDLYISGESYAGKYVPALVYAIHKGNQNAKEKINLAGMAIGDGLCDPVTMTDYGDFLYQVGLVDEEDRDFFKKQGELVVSLINQQKWLKAFQVFDALLNGDRLKGPSYFTNITGLHFYYNYLYEKEPKDMGTYSKYVNQAVVRKHIHVGNLTFHDGREVESYLLEDIMQSVKPWIEEIMDNGYKVMLYNGQLDIIVANALTENFVNSLKWKYADKFHDAKRLIWRVDDEVAGYVREVPSFALVMIRNAGHMVPYDQPKWAFNMITHFTHGKSFLSKKISTALETANDI